MFEFFGWASINVDTSGNDEQIVNEEADKAFLLLLNQQIKQTQADGLVEVRLTDRIHGDFYALTIVGMTNHRNQKVIDLFHWLSWHCPTAYGLLYVWDDEDYREGRSYENDFKAWRLCRGELKELEDPFLSPRIPTIEDPVT